MNIWMVIYRVCWVLLIALCVVGSACIYVPRINNMRALQQDKVRKEQENARIRAEIDDLRNRQERFQNDPGYVEHVAREQGMVKRGEVLFKLAPGTGSGQPTEPSNP